MKDLLFGARTLNEEFSKSVEALDEEKQKEALKEGDDFYRRLAEAIKASKITRDKQAQSKQKHFQQQIDLTLSSLEGLYDKLVEQSGKEEESTRNEKIEIMQKIQGMLIALQSLSKNQSRYNREYLDHRLDEMLKQIENDEDKEIVKDALMKIVQNNAYNKGRKSVSFDATMSEMHFGLEESRIKRVKIEHDDKGKVVTGTFSYDRKTLFGDSVEEVDISSREEKYKNFRDEIKDFVNVAAYEYNKGSQEKPIMIIFKGQEQPEAALALLLEYKALAFERKEPFYARDRNGEEVIITDSATFSPKELNYFKHYANACPEIVDRDGNKKISEACAGYNFLKNESPPFNEQYKKEINETHLEMLLENTIRRANDIKAARREHNIDPNPLSRGSPRLYSRGGGM